MISEGGTKSSKLGADKQKDGRTITHDAELVVSMRRRRAQAEWCGRLNTRPPPARGVGRMTMMEPLTNSTSCNCWSNSWSEEDVAGEAVRAIRSTGCSSPNTYRSRCPRDHCPLLGPRDPCHPRFAPLREVQASCGGDRNVS